MEIIVPFPQCIFCMKHRCPLLWFVHQSSPGQSSNLPAGHQLYQFSCLQSRLLELKCCSWSCCSLLVHLLFAFPQAAAVWMAANPGKFENDIYSASFFSFFFFAHNVIFEAFISSKPRTPCTCECSVEVKELLPPAVL